MKAFRICFFIFLFSIYIDASKAENIKDFEIEGISLGDSLLDFYSEKYIKTKSKDYGYSDKSFTPLSNVTKNVKTYDAMQIYYKTDTPKKIIYALDGVAWYKNNIKACEKEKKKQLMKLQLYFQIQKKKILELLNIRKINRAKVQKTNLDLFLMTVVT